MRTKPTRRMVEGRDARVELSQVPRTRPGSDLGPSSARRPSIWATIHRLGSGAGGATGWAARSWRLRRIASASLPAVGMRHAWATATSAACLVLPVASMVRSRAAASPTTSPALRVAIPLTKNALDPIFPRVPPRYPCLTTVAHALPDRGTTGSADLGTSWTLPRGIRIEIEVRFPYSSRIARSWRPGYRNGVANGTRRRERSLGFRLSGVSGGNAVLLQLLAEVPSVHSCFLGSL